MIDRQWVISVIVGLVGIAALIAFADTYLG
jgi:hypothetical protein